MQGTHLLSPSPPSQHKGKGKKKDQKCFGPDVRTSTQPANSFLFHFPLTLSGRDNYEIKCWLVAIQIDYDTLFYCITFMIYARGPKGVNQSLNYLCLKWQITINNVVTGSDLYMRIFCTVRMICKKSVLETYL